MEKTEPTFPISATFWASTQWAYDWSQLYIDTFKSVLTSHIVSTLVYQGTIPGSGNSNTSREGRVEVGYQTSDDSNTQTSTGPKLTVSYAQRRILHA